MHIGICLGLKHADYKRDILSFLVLLIYWPHVHKTAESYWINTWVNAN